MKKKLFVAPECTVITLETNDIIATSDDYGSLPIGGNGNGKPAASREGGWFDEDE